MAFWSVLSILWFPQPGLLSVGTRAQPRTSSFFKLSAVRRALRATAISYHLGRNLAAFQNHVGTVALHFDANHGQQRIPVVVSFRAAIVGPHVFGLFLMSQLFAKPLRRSPNSATSFDIKRAK